MRINAYINKIIKNKFIHNALTLIGGTAISQLIAFIASLIIFGIYYTDFDLGVNAIYVLWMEVATIVVTGRYEMSILLPEKDEDGYNLTALCIMLASGISLIIFAVIMILFLLYGNHFSPKVWEWILLLPAGIVLLGNYQALNYWYIRRKQFKRISVNRILQTGSYALFAIIYALLQRKYNYKYNGLIISQVCSQAFVMILFYISFITDNRNNGFYIDWVKIKELAIRYMRFPKVTVFSGLVNALSYRLPIIFIDYFFGKSILGQYNFTNRIMSTPVTLVSTAIGDVFRQKASEEFSEKGNCRYTYTRTLKGLIVFSLIAFAIIGLLAKWLLNLVFGDKWSLAGDFIRVMTILFVVKFIASPLSFILIITEKLKTDLVWQICLSVSVIIISFVGYYLWQNVIMIIILFTVVYSIAYVINIFITYKASSGKDKKRHIEE